MRQFSVCVAGVLAAAAIGCGSGKELPDEIPTFKEHQAKPAEPELKIPTVSDPDARAFIDQAIKTFTQNDPARLARGKTSKSVATGSMKLPLNSGGALVSVPTTRTFLARWPDQMKVVFQHEGRLDGVTTQVLQGSLTWFFLNSELQPNLNPKATEEVYRTDTLAQHWLPLLFPLAEPSAVVFDLRKGAGTPPADRVRFTMPGRPVYELSFDPATGYLTRVEYRHAELTGTVYKVWTFGQHKSFDGLVPPTQLEYSQSPERARAKETLQEWTVSVWEFPPKLDDAAFEPPK